MERADLNEKDMEEVEKIKQKTTSSVSVQEKNKTETQNRLEKSVASSFSNKKGIKL